MTRLWFGMALVSLGFAGCSGAVVTAEDGGHDTVPLADAGVDDGGAAADAGLDADGGGADAGPVVDGGGPIDAGTLADAGVNDGGLTLDGGGATDGGPGADAGSADAGTPFDGGAFDAGAPVDAGPMGDGGVRHRPALTHPRLFGSNAEWRAFTEPLFQAPCSAAPGGWGNVIDVRDTWDLLTRGARTCDGQTPSFTNHPANPYFQGTTPTFDDNRARATLHLIRRMAACREAGGSCDFTAQQMATLTTNFITTEMARFTSTYVTSPAEKADPGNIGPVGNRTKNINWSQGYAYGYDLITGPLVQYWSLFVDTLWADLTPTQRDTIMAELVVRVDAWVKADTLNHWSYTNGNNWSPTLAAGVAYYAIAFYDEDPRAEQLLDMVVESNQKHRDFYLPGGGYKESTSYVLYSFETLFSSELVFKQSLGAPVGAYDQARMVATGNWVLDFMGTDGRVIDFGDAHRGTGHGVTALAMALWPEIVGPGARGSTVIDPCWARDFFANKYWDYGFRDPWEIPPAMARDWLALVAQCTTPMLGAPKVALYPAFGATARVGQPGLSATGMRTELRAKQADGAMVAISAVPNTYPHMELDFAAIVWTAFGHRFLSDASYGLIVNPAPGTEGSYNTTLNPDWVPSATNALVVPEAHFNNNLSTDFSQIHGQVGSVSTFTLGTRTAIDVDASTPYGKNSALGWLSSFHRYVVPLPPSHFVVVDALKVRTARGTAAPEEYWFSKHNAAATCSQDVGDIAVTADGTQAVRLVPRCSALVTNTAAEGAGRMQAASLRPGQFVIDGLRTTVAGEDERTRFRWVPDAAAADDVRAFVLTSAVNVAGLPAPTLSVGNCVANAANVCISATVGAENMSLTLTRSGDDWVRVP